LEQLCQSDPAKTRSLPKTQGHSRISVRDGFKKKYSTSTVYGQEYLVPWLASEGPLAYTPEEPPAKDYFFQYSWILPKIFDPEENLRNHFYFGIRYKHGAKVLFQFWERARKGHAQQNVCKLGLLATKEVKAPIAAYHHALEPGSKWGSLLIQHGSYQWIDLESQPHIERGEVLLYRGIERASASRYLWLEPEKLAPFNLEKA
jgi:hypothetical protein